MGLRPLLVRPSDSGLPVAPGAGGHDEAAMTSRSLLERRLAEVGARLKQLASELTVTDDQLAQLAEQADEARLRALVSETPLAARDHADAQKHADAMQRHRAEVVAAMAQLERRQDDLLDRLMAEIG
ncbi:MAG: hypothetical protein ACT4PW_05550 [Acidimicrobiia bacterium]